MARLDDGIPDILIILDCAVDTLWSGQAEGSLLEQWIDHGNTIIWTGDYAFWAYRDLSPGQNSHRIVGDSGDDRVLDISPIVFRTTTYQRTAAGAQYIPSLPAVYSADSRPINRAALGPYVVDEAFACDNQGYCDAIVIHNPLIGGGYFFQAGMLRWSDLPSLDRAQMIREFITNWLLPQGQRATVTHGAPEGFGVEILAVENLSTGQVPFACSDRVGVRAAADAGLCLDHSTGRTLRVRLEDPDGNVRAEAALYDDGTHGDAVANDGLWTNTTDLRLPPTLGPDGGTWIARVFADDNGYRAADAANFQVKGFATNVRALSLSGCQGGSATLGFAVSNLSSGAIQHLKGRMTQSLSDGIHTLLNSYVSFTPQDFSLDPLESGHPVTLTISIPVGQALGTYTGTLTLWADEDTDDAIDDCLSTAVSVTLMIGACGTAGALEPPSLNAAVAMPCPCVDGLAVYHVYTATNLAETADRGNISLIPAGNQLWPVTVLRDVAGDDVVGTYVVTDTTLADDVVLAYAANGRGGSGGWTWVNPAADTGSDGIPDTGDLDPGEGVHIVVKMGIPCGTLADISNFAGLSIYSHNDWQANHSEELYDDEDIYHGTSMNVTTVAPTPCGMISPHGGAVSVAPCQKAYFVQRWEQAGAMPDRGNISLSGNARGLLVRAYRDLGLDDLPGEYTGATFAPDPNDRLIAADEDGDGVWDVVVSAYDTDEDGIPDTGDLTPYGGYTHIIWEIELPCECDPSLFPGVVTTTVRGSSHWDWQTNHPTLPFNDEVIFHDEVPLAITITARPGVYLGAETSSSVTWPGQQQYYKITLNNSGNITDTYEFALHSSQGYTVTLYAEDCLSPIADSGGGPGPDVELPPCSEITLCVGISIPMDTSAETLDRTVVTATSSVSSAISSTVVLETLVRTVVAGLIGPRDLSEAAYPGHSAYYCQEWRNSGNNTDRGNIALVPDRRWPVRIWRDVNGDSPLGVLSALQPDDVLIAEDSNGDGLFDYINPTWDTDHDGIPDTGDLAADPDGPGPLLGGAVRLIVGVTVPPGTPKNALETLLVQGFSHRDWRTRAPGGPYNDPDLFHDQVTLYTLALGADFQISKTPWQPWACPGWNESFTIVVTNSSDSTLTQIAITDVLPSLTYLVPERTTGGYTLAPGAVVWTIPELRPGASRSYDITLRLGSNVRVRSTLTNTVWVSALEAGQVYSATAAVSVIPCPGGTPTATATPGTPTTTPTPTEPTPTATPQPTVIGWRCYIPLVLK